MDLTRGAADAASIEYQVDKPQWFAICTNPMQEEHAYQNLLASRVECFNPKIQESRRNQFTGVVTFIARPLFPRYMESHRWRY